jgi:carbon monoxide dehydrogenase subunit G
MNITQRFTVRHPTAVVWQALADVPLVAQCLPGAELDESSDGHRYKGRMKVKLGPLSTAFAGEAAVERDEAQQTGSLEGAGTDSRSNSRAKARMTYALTPEDGGRATTVAVDAEITLTGALAQFGRGSILNDVAARLATEFAGRLQERLNATAASAPQDAPEDPAAAPQSAPPAPAELRPLQLLLDVLKARLVAFFRRLVGSTQA